MFVPGERGGRETDPGGGRLLDAVAKRVLARYLKRSGAASVMVIDSKTDPTRLAGVDLVYSLESPGIRAKVMPDPYFGTDRGKIADKDLPFYREAANSYAFETISNHVTRDPGWMFSSVADELHYYFLAIDQSEEDVAALMHETDQVFFSELAVERDELHVLPMPPLRAWFGANHEAYTPRPVRLGDHSGWYRIVPAAEISRAVPSLQVRGPIFAGLDRI